MMTFYWVRIVGKRHWFAISMAMTMDIFIAAIVVMIFIRHGGFEKFLHGRYRRRGWKHHLGFGVWIFSAVSNYRYVDCVSLQWNNALELAKEKDYEWAIGCFLAKGNVCLSLTHVRFIRSTSDVDGVKIWMSLEISGFWMLWTKLDRELAEDYRARYGAINLVMDRATVLINHLESFSHVAPGRYTTFYISFISLLRIQGKSQDPDVVGTSRLFHFQTSKTNK